MGPPQPGGQQAHWPPAGEVRVEISEVLPLAEVQQAHELSESGHTRGKIVLTV